MQGGRSSGQKNSHTGMAGDFAALAEFLLRGYNVAIPAVDVGDDVFVVNDHKFQLWRVQVKTTTCRRNRAGRLIGSCTIPLRQLATPVEPELTYLFLFRSKSIWIFLPIPRAELHRMRADYLEDPAPKKGPTPGDDAASITMAFVFERGAPWCWGRSFKAYMNDWSAWPRINEGPGATRRAAADSTDRRR